MPPTWRKKSQSSSGTSTTSSGTVKRTSAVTPTSSVPAASTSTVTPAPGSSTVVAVYVPDWATFLPQQLPAGVDCVNYCFGDLSTAGEIKDSADAAQLELWEKSPYHLMYSIGGSDGSENFSEVMANHRSEFFDEIEHVSQKYGCGIDIDWEYPGEAGGAKTWSKNDIPNLCQALDGVTSDVSMAIGTDGFTEAEWAMLDEVIDWFNLMTYDYGGPWVNTVQPLAGVSEVVETLELIKKQGAPMNKIMLGIPLYGYLFTGASAFGKKYKTCTGDEIGLNALPPKGFTPITNGAINTAKNEIVIYDDESTFATKLALVSDYGLRGVFFWSADLDSTTNSRIAQAINTLKN